MTENTAPPVPAQAAGMKRVSMDEFYKRIGPLNVHPTPMGPYHRDAGYVSEWRLLDSSRRLVGVCDGGTVFLESRYWLAEE